MDLRLEEGRPDWKAKERLGGFEGKCPFSRSWEAHPWASSSAGDLPQNSTLAQVSKGLCIVTALPAFSGLLCIAEKQKLHFPESSAPWGFSRGCK